MRALSLLLLIALAACGDSSGPQGLDPVVLANNNQAVNASITWWDQSGQVQPTLLPGFTSNKCIKFVSTQVSDSVRFEVVVGDTTGASGSWSKQWSPWFDPTTGIPKSSAGSYPDGAEYWTLDIGPSTGDVLMKAVKSPPC